MAWTHDFQVSRCRGPRVFALPLTWTACHRAEEGSDLDSLNSWTPTAGRSGEGGARNLELGTSSWSLEELLRRFLSRHEQGQVVSTLKPGSLNLEVLGPREVSRVHTGLNSPGLPGTLPLPWSLESVHGPRLVLLEAREVSTHYSWLLQLARGFSPETVVLVLNAGLLHLHPEERAGHPIPDDLALLRTISELRIHSPCRVDQLLQQIERGLERPGVDVIRCAPFPWAAWADSSRLESEASLPEGGIVRLSLGRHGAILASGSSVRLALDLARRLERQGLGLEVWEASTLQPLDRPGLERICASHPVLFTLEDHSLRGGLGTLVVENPSRSPDCEVVRLGWPAPEPDPASRGEVSPGLDLAEETILRRIQENLVPRVHVRRPLSLPEIPEVDLERSSQFIQEVKNLPLNDWLVELIGEYEEVGDRNSFLWRWVRRGVEITTLSCVDPDRWDHVCDTKTLGVLFDVLLDDVADAETDTQFLEMLIAITLDAEVDTSELGPDRLRYFEFSRKVWKLLDERVRQYPRHDHFREVLRFDYHQLMNSMRYSALIKEHPFIMNVPEHDAYLPHNMHMVVSGTIDVMASPGFDLEDMGRLRKVLLYAQYMGRIGNLVTTWEREIREKDYSSGVFPLALALGILSVQDLQEGDPELIRDRIRGSDIENRFLYRWQQLREKILSQAPLLKSVDVGQLVEGLETLIQLHLGSRGLK